MQKTDVNYLLHCNIIYYKRKHIWDNSSKQLTSFSATCLTKSTVTEKLSVGTLVLCTDPELDEEECVVWPFFIQLLQASFLLRELVVNLPHIYGLQHRVIVARVWWADVYKKMFILSEGKRSDKKDRKDLFFGKALYSINVCTVSLSLCVSRKAEYSSSRSFAEAMVLSCHTGAAIAAGRWGGRGS